MTTQLIELGNELKTKRQSMMDFYAGFTKAGDAQAPVMTGEDINKLKGMTTEVEELQGKYDTMLRVEALGEMKTQEPQQPVYGQPRQRKSLSDMFFEQKGLEKARNDMGIELALDAKALEAEFKTTMTTGSNGYPPQVLRDGSVVPAISRPPQLIDYLIMEPTTQNGIKFMKQTTRTNAAAAKSEGSSVDEAAITYQEQTDIISKIGVWIPVSEEQLDDEPQARSIIDTDLILMVRQELDRQFTVGNGSAPELRGIYNASSIATQAKGADPAADAIMKAITKVNVTGRANAGLIVLHGTDRQNLALTRSSDGVYLFVNPLTGMLDRLWGLPVVGSEALTAGNGLVFDPFYFRAVMRSGVNVAITNSHSTYFPSSLLAIRATVRAGLKKMRDEAGCTVTGL